MKLEVVFESDSFVYTGKLSILSAGEAIVEGLSRNEATHFLMGIIRYRSLQHGSKLIVLDLEQTMLRAFKAAYKLRKTKQNRDYFFVEV